VLHRGKVLANGTVADVIKQAGAQTMRGAFDALTREPSP
jgi:hypothetical protein